MAFIKFGGKIGRGTSVQPMLTVGRSGIIGINKAATQKYELQQYKYAGLYYDPEGKMIGIKPTNDELEANCTMRDRQSGMDISAKSFLEYFEIDYSTTQRYELSREEQNDMLVAKIGGE